MKRDWSGCWIANGSRHASKQGPPYPYRSMRSGAALSSLGAGSADAAIESLGFDCINPSDPFPNSIFILDFYNGGTGTVGTAVAEWGAVLAHQQRDLPEFRFRL
jgi:hypothetical protein